MPAAGQTPYSIGLALDNGSGISVSGAGVTDSGSPSVPPIWQHPEFARGAREMTGIALGIAAWGLLTGIAMAKSDLPMPLAVLMSLIVYAGSAQLAVLPLLVSAAPLWVVWATALCVNLRFVVFSASWRQHFGALPRGRRALMSYFCADLNYALFSHRFPRPAPVAQSVPYFWGSASLNWLAWQLPSLIGLAVGDRIPTAWGLGFAGSLALLGFVYSLLNGCVPAALRWCSSAGHVIAASATAARLARPWPGSRRSGRPRSGTKTAQLAEQPMQRALGAGERASAWRPAFSLP